MKGRYKEVRLGDHIGHHQRLSSLSALVATQFTDMLLKYDTQLRPKEYSVTDGVLQDMVVDSFLWFL